MANPNIVGVTTLTGKTDYFSFSETSATVVLSNAASSGKVFKVNTIIVANDDGTNAADITVSLNSAAAGGGTAFQIASTISVIADSTLVLIDKASAFYLLEDKSLVATASAANDLNLIVSYEEIS